MKARKKAEWKLERKVL